MIHLFAALAALVGCCVSMVFAFASHPPAMDMRWLIVILAIVVYLTVFVLSLFARTVLYRKLGYTGDVDEDNGRPSR